MTVKELKAILAHLPDEMEVIMQKDIEGNGYSPLNEVDGGMIYIPETPWSGEVLDPAWDAEDVDIDEDEWEEIREVPKVVVLIPAN